jgi:hypothetical protein
MQIFSKSAKIFISGVFLYCCTYRFINSAKVHGEPIGLNFVAAFFVEAKKGAQKLVKPRAAKAPKLWQSWTIDLFLSPCLLRVLHHMRIDANSLLPTTQIESSHQLKMVDLLDATDEDGWSNDFSPGFNHFEE